MKILNKEIEVRRGETFPLDYIVRNKDNSPYIISDRLANPYFLITVSTTKYAQRDRYIMNYWLDLKNYPRFNVTQPIDLHSIKSSPDGIEPRFNTFDDVTSVPIEGVYIDGKPVTLFADDKGNFVNEAVFYIEHEDGTREYKYWETRIDSTGQPIGWQDYDCRIVKIFSTEDTSKWVEQSYVYSIRLVSGEDTLHYLRSLCKANNITYLDTDTSDVLFNKLHEANVDFEVDLTKPLQWFDFVQTILPATKLSVLSNINGGV